MKEDPRIFRLDTSSELSEFPSEADLPSESGPQSEEPPSPAVVSPMATPTFDASADAPTGAPPFAPGLLDVAVATVGHFPEEGVSDEAIIDDGVADQSFADEPVHVTPHAGPARVTDFPVRAHSLAAVALPSLPAGPVTLVDLIARRGGFDWREAVAVIHQICLYLRRHSPQAPILLDPRNIQITDKGEVRLLSGQTSSDPLVIQVGRLLRTMLMGKEAPPELRLLLSQATFELPIFESIEDVDRALAQLNRLDEPGPAGLALLRAVAAPPPLPNPEDFDNRPPPIRSILPSHRGTGRRVRSRSHLGSLLGGYASHVGVIFAAIAIIGVLLFTRPAMLFPSDALSTAGTLTTSAIPATTIATIPPAVPAGASEKPELPRERKATVPNDRAASPRVDRPTAAHPDRAGSGRATPLGTSPPEPDPPRPTLRPRRPTAMIGVARTPTTSTSGSAPHAPSSPPLPSPRDSEMRATSLLAQGQAAAAAAAFDALVTSNPLYQPRPTDLTPEALNTFRTSQQRLLPGIAQRDYDRAKAAFVADDPDQALALAREALAIIEKGIVTTPPQLKEDLQYLVEQATAAAATVNEIIYTEDDAGVIPPRPLSRQMPVTSPTGVPPNRVGWLEMVIDRNGTVAFVKLHTPLNRHHERMIVSPAKAWRYRPATKNGKPVMFRMLVKVNLPESGTDF
jgi:hypothetical protein